MEWRDVLREQKQQPYFAQIMDYVDQRRAQGHVVYPPQDEVFNAFDLTPFSQLKVVILGQDPYHGPDQAHGLSFSVKRGVKIPPSLRNIYKELAEDIDGFCMPEHGNLTAWAEQGVLLLNNVLTVEQGQPQSHAKIGWQKFTSRVVESINRYQQGVVFLLWGKPAQQKAAGVDSNRHSILCAPHPSPLSAHRGFFGCRHFSQTNQLLIEQGERPIEWQV